LKSNKQRHFHLTNLLSHEGNLCHEAKGSDKVLEGEFFEDRVWFVVGALGGPGGDLGQLSSFGVTYKLDTRHYSREREVRGKEEGHKKDWQTFFKRRSTMADFAQKEK
jgi:hypothetical protein